MFGNSAEENDWRQAQQITLPALGYSHSTQRIYWKPPLYSSILAILQNPMYAGAYAFGRTEARTKVVAGRPRQTSGHQKPREQWTVLIRDHHTGYISWEQFELNQKARGKCSYEIAHGTAEGTGRSELVGGAASAPPLRTHVAR